MDTDPNDCKCKELPGDNALCKYHWPEPPKPPEASQTVSVGSSDWLDALLSVAADVGSAAAVIRFEISHSDRNGKCYASGLRESAEKLEKAKMQIMEILRQSQQGASNVKS